MTLMKLIAISLIEKVFNYLSDIKNLEHWYVDEHQTPLIQNYLSFWNTLSDLYFEFTKNNHQNGKAHQGYVYREAAKTWSTILMLKNTKTTFL